MKDARGQGLVVARGDNNLRFVSRGDCYYQRTPAGYLVDVTHRFGGPADNDSESDSESNLE